VSGYTTYLRYQRIEEQARLLGFRLANPKHGHWGGGSNDGIDQVALYADGEALPVYSRDAELFTGTFNQVEVFLTGWAKAQQYDMLLRISDEKKRKFFEGKEVERQRIAREKIEQKKVWAILTSQEVDQ
jgi:hypothetical protein